MIPNESIVAGLQEVVDSYVDLQKRKIGDFGFNDYKDEMFAVLGAFRTVFPWIRWDCDEAWNDEYQCWYYTEVTAYIDGDEDDFTEPDDRDLEMGFNPYLGCYDGDC